MLPLLLLIPLLQGSAIGGELRDPSPGGPRPEQEVLTLEELAERDLRLSFGRGSAGRARRFLSDELDQAGPAPSADSLTARGAALVALGAGGNESDVIFLETQARAGKITLRRAAVLALGDLGEAGLPALERVARSHGTGLENALVIALEGASGERARRLLAELFGGEAAALVNTPGFAEPVLRMRYELRWEAARRFGFLDGRRLEELQLEELLASAEFLDRFVFSLVDRLETSAVRPHLIEALDAPGRPGAVRGAMRSMPQVMRQVLTSDGWRALTVREWSSVLDQVDEDRSWSESGELLERAAGAAPPLRERVLEMLVRGGHQPPASWRRDAFEQPSLALQRALLESAGDSGDASRIPDVQLVLARFVQPRLATSGSVALARLGHEPSLLDVQALLTGGPIPDRARVIGALSRVAYDPVVLRLLGEVALRTDLREQEREQILLGYLEAGRLPDRAALRSWLALEGTSHPLATRVVRSLAQRPKEEDLELFDSLFPAQMASEKADRPGEAEAVLDLNLELALALHRHRDPLGGALLRAALWSDDWNRSVLAGGLLVESSGMHAILFELETPPTRVTDRDLRRVGFAIGEFGGLPAVEQLGRTRDERDPALQGAFLGALAARAED